MSKYNCDVKKIEVYDDSISFDRPGEFTNFELTNKDIPDEFLRISVDNYGCEKQVSYLSKEDVKRLISFLQEII